MAEDKKKPMSTKKAAVLGAVAGVVVGAAAVAMSDPKNRAKVSDAAKKLGKKASGALKKAGKVAEDMREEVVDAVNEARKK